MKLAYQLNISRWNGNTYILNECGLFESLEAAQNYLTRNGYNIHEGRVALVYVYNDAFLCT